MRRPIFNKDDTVERKISILESIISRLAVRSHKTTTAIITPHLISSCVTGTDVRGDILKVMLFEGSITKGMIAFNKRPKNPIAIEVKVLNNDIGFTKTYYIDRVRLSVDLDVGTVDGSMVTVAVHPTVDDEKSKITEVWISMLWTPHVSKTKIKQHLIENLENASEVNLIEEG